MCKQLILYLMQKTSVRTPFQLCCRFFCVCLVRLIFLRQNIFKQIIEFNRRMNSSEERKKSQNTEIEWPENWNIALKHFQKLFKSCLVWAWKIYYLLRKRPNLTIKHNLSRLNSQKCAELVFKIHHLFIINFAK